MALNLARLLRLIYARPFIHCLYFIQNLTVEIHPCSRFSEASQKTKARFVKLSIRGYHHLGVRAYLSLKLTLSELKLSRNNCKD